MARMGLSVLLCVSISQLVASGCTDADRKLRDAGLEDSRYDYQAIVDGIWALNLAPTPEHLMQKDPPRDRSEFDPNAYFSVLKHVSMAEGYVLDYVYDSDGGNGRPLLYARKIDAEPFETFDAYAGSLGGRKAAWDTDRAFLGFVQADGSPESFFELVVLNEMAGHFYLEWHAGYSDRKVIASEKAMEQLIANHSGTGGFTWSQKRKLRKADCRPFVSFDEVGAAQVTVCSFTNWGGLTRMTYSLQRAYPHRILEEKAELLVEYDCGIQY